MALLTIDETQEPAPQGSTLLALGASAMKVTERGRLLIRNVAMAFDAYLGKPKLVPLQRMQY